MPSGLDLTATKPVLVPSELDLQVLQRAAYNDKVQSANEMQSQTCSSTGVNLLAGISAIVVVDKHTSHYIAVQKSPAEQNLAEPHSIEAINHLSTS